MRASTIAPSPRQLGFTFASLTAPPMTAPATAPVAAPVAAPAKLATAKAPETPRASSATAPRTAPRAPARAETRTATPTIPATTGTSREWPMLRTLPPAHGSLIARDAIILAHLHEHAAGADTALTAQLAACAITGWSAAAQRGASRNGVSPLILALRGALAIEAALATWTPMDGDPARALRDPLAPGRLQLPSVMSALERRMLGGTMNRLEMDATRRWRLLTHATTGTPMRWDVAAVATDLAELQAHWHAIVQWLHAAVTGPALPAWTHPWRADTAPWFSVANQPAPPRAARPRPLRVAQHA